MPNKECNGDFFYTENNEFPYYCCMWDSSVVSGVKQGEECPRCKRKIKAGEHKKELKIEKETILSVTIPGRGKVVIFSNSFTSYGITKSISAKGE